MNDKSSHAPTTPGLRAPDRDPDMEKQIYLEPPWKIHVAYRELITSPPQGYRFVSSEGVVDKISLGVSRLQLAPWLVAQAFSLAPMTLLKSYLDRFTRRPPEGTALTYACGHLVFRNEPWVIDLGIVNDPIGTSPHHFRRFKSILETAFASGLCKKILCSSEFAKRTVLTSLDCSRFLPKLEILPQAVRAPSFVRSPRDRGGVRLLFLGSANMAGEFASRGGYAVVEAFLALRQRYEGLGLTIRSDLPREARQRLHGCPDVRVIEGVIPREELERLFLTHDIFLFPGYYTAWVVILEAMSYGLPVIATDVHSTAEHVIDGQTGLLLRPGRLPDSYGHLPVAGFSNELLKAFRTPDPELVAELVEKASLLIENEELRQRLGEKARYEVQRGRFSIERRTSVLKRVLDEATQEAPEG